MRLLTHNLLCCLKCQTFPLQIESTTVAPADAAFDADFTKRMLARIHYQYLYDAFEQLHAQQKHTLAHASSIPASVEEIDLNDPDSDSLKAVHYAMCAVAVMEGSLVCGACSTRFPISGGIPNMMIE